MTSIFQVELPAAVSWALGPDRAARITQPTLVIGGESIPEQFRMVYDDVLALLPRATGRVVAGATHNVIACRADVVAGLIEDFAATLR